MDRQLGISAGGIVIHQDRILLVRYNDGPGGSSYFVAPGGKVESAERIDQAVVREVREETGLEVVPSKILFVEDLVWGHGRTCKIWFLCDIVGGQLTDTQGAKEEGITEAGWYGRDRLDNEVVYPNPLLSYDWNLFFKDMWEAIYLKTTSENRP